MYENPGRIRVYRTLGTYVYGCSHVEKTWRRKSTSLVQKRNLRGGTPDCPLQQREKQHDDDHDDGATIPSIFTLVTFSLEGCKFRIWIFRLSGFQICIYILRLSTSSFSTRWHPVLLHHDITRWSEAYTFLHQKLELIKSKSTPRFLVHFPIEFIWVVKAQMHVGWLCFGC